jgi:hypothetical protein
LTLPEGKELIVFAFAMYDVGGTSFLEGEEVLQMFQAQYEHDDYDGKPTDGKLREMLGSFIKKQAKLEGSEPQLLENFTLDIVQFDAFVKHHPQTIEPTFHLQRKVGRTKKVRACVCVCVAVILCCLFISFC